MNLLKVDSFTGIYFLQIFTSRGGNSYRRIVTKQVVAIGLYQKGHYQLEDFLGTFFKACVCYLLSNFYFFTK